MRSGHAESLFVRERCLAYLSERQAHIVVDRARPGDGWRADLVLSLEGEECALWIDKPDAAPYACFGVVAAAACPRNVDEFISLIETVSDYDLSPSFDLDRRESIHLAARLPISGLNHEDLDFHVENLLHGRAAVCAWDDLRRDAEEARPIHQEPGRDVGP